MKNIKEFKRDEKGQFTETEKSGSKPVSKIKTIIRTLLFVTVAMGYLSVSGTYWYNHAPGWKPEIKNVFASQTVYQVIDKETEEEALERRTEEILFENIQTYYDDAHKKALAEKVEALKSKIASTTEITKEDTDELKAKLKRADQSLR